MNALVSWATLHRQRIARLLLVATVCFGATRVWPAVPHTTEVRFEMGAQHREIMEIQVGFTREGEGVHGTLLRFPEGAPATVVHEVMLPSGHYDVQIRCRRPTGVTAVDRVIEVPSDGEVRVDVTGDRV